MKKTLDALKDILVVGLALFAMFFGAGNLIFPPRLGVECGSEWLTGFIFYFLIDVGLGILAVFSVVRHQGDTTDLLKPLGHIPAKAVMTLVILCIGPGIALPRTAATTYELGILPLLKAEPGPVSMAVFSAAFFAAALLLSIRSSRVVDIIGKFLTPVLLAALLLLIFRGITSPLDHLRAPLAESSVGTGVLNGYQTLDMLAAILFTIILISAVHDRGYRDAQSARPVIIASSLLSGALLFIVYGGLAFLGATSGGAWSAQVHREELSDAGLLVNIADGLLGRYGTVLLAVVVTFACLTTAISLIAASADYFSKLFAGRVSYEKLVIAVCLVACLICNLGLTRIISIAAPVLTLLYPVMADLLLASFVRSRIPQMLPHSLSAVTAFAVSIVSTIAELAPDSAAAAVDAALPLSSCGFEWVLPAAIAFLIGLIPAKAGRSTARTDR